MSRLPQRNATLTAITGPGFSADADDPATTGEAKWTGSADAYVTEDVVPNVNGRDLDLIDKVALIVPGDLRPSVEITRGDTVTFVYANSERTRTVRAVRARLMPGVPQTVKIDLEDG